MRVKAAAKINLVLDVTGKRPDGYHTIESVFQTVGIYDEVTVELTESDIALDCEVPEEFASAEPIPCDERNIAYKAARLFFDENHMNCGCRIHIKKGIPSQAGMGGGSADAAAVLYCLTALTGERVSAPERLGADVPFFLTGGTAYVEGIGEVITPIAGYPGRILVIAKGTAGVSTAEAYRNIDSLTDTPHPDAKKLAEALESAPDEAYRYFGNLFEAAVRLDDVDRLISVMTNCGSLKANMTGSGSAVFGLFGDTAMAEKCAEELKKQGFFARVCETVPESFIILEKKSSG